MTDAVSKFIFRHCRDLIDHKSRKSIEAVAFVGRNHNAKQRRFSWIGGNGADRNGFGCIEVVILQNDRRSRLARSILATGDRPYFSTPQSVTRLHCDCIDKILVPSRIRASCHRLRLTMGFSLKRCCARVAYPNLDRPQPSRAQPLTKSTDLLAGGQTLWSRPAL